MRILKAALVAIVLTAFIGILSWKVPLFGLLAIIAASMSIAMAGNALGRDVNGFFIPNAAGIVTMILGFCALVFTVAYIILPADGGSERWERLSTIRIDGSTVESFRRTFAELQVTLTPAERTQLRQKLARLHASTFDSSGSRNGFSAEALREQLHNCSFAEIMARPR
jgi:predicted PurR-regulated permease PerM